MFSTPEMTHVFSDEEMIQSWLDAEIALAKAQHKAGIFPKEILDDILSAATIENINLDEMREEFEKIGFPILPFVHQLQKACGPEAAKWIHYGSTTQDILDTGTVLQMRKGLRLIDENLIGIIRSLVTLANTHKKTVMAGRTFQQLAAPITFGYKVSVWLDELLRHTERLEELKKRLFVGQCAGAVGVFATLGDNGPKVQKWMIEELDLQVADSTWHTARDRWTELVSWFSMLSATLGKIANEVAILMRSEVAEVSEPFESGRGASSTMPQKRNPIQCEPIIAIAHKMRELCSSQTTAMIQEHERGVGQMHLEWMVIPEAFILISGSLTHARHILEGLVVFPDQMLENLKQGGGLLMSEAVMMALAPKIGRNIAHDLITHTAAEARRNEWTLKKALLKDSEIREYLSDDEIEKSIDPAGYTGIAEQTVEKIVAKAERVLSSKNKI